VKLRIERAGLAPREAMARHAVNCGASLSVRDIWFELGCDPRSLGCNALPIRGGRGEHPTRSTSVKETW